jgi:hypothetical protein
VNIRIKEPVDLKIARQGMKSFLRNFVPNPNSSRVHTQICLGLGVDVNQANSVKESKFRLGVISSPDFGGWVGQELLDQSADAFARKEDIRRRVAENHNEVWLAVGSSLTMGDMAEYTPSLQLLLRNHETFARLILVNKLRPLQSTMVSPF